MNLFKKEWSPDEADEWTIHDLAACVLGVLAFFLVTIGVAGALLLKLWGFLSLLLTGICVYWMVRIIDPKLKSLSQIFETKQAQYLEDLERTTRWGKRRGG